MSEEHATEPTFSRSCENGDMSNEEAVQQSPVPHTAADAPEPIEVRTEVEVGLQRSVRYGPVIIGTAIVGALVAAIAALFFPVGPEAEYELGQIVGFMALIGAAIGLGLGAVLTLILGRVAKRHRGAAIAVLTDVR